MEKRDENEQALAASLTWPRPASITWPRVPLCWMIFKFKYFNEHPLCGVAIFWGAFGKDDWYLWYGEYCFPEGFTQNIWVATSSLECSRLDKLRKNAFVIVFENNNSSSIFGVWVFPGLELTFLLCAEWQVYYESYTWQKPYPHREETQTLFQEYFFWEGAFHHVGKASVKAKSSSEQFLLLSSCLHLPFKGDEGH